MRLYDEQRLDELGAQLEEMEQMKKDPNDVRPVEKGGIVYPSVNEFARLICLVNGVQIRDEFDGSENWWMFIGNARVLYENAKLIERDNGE